MAITSDLLSIGADTDFEDFEITEEMRVTLYDITKVLNIYQSAMKEVLTKLEILDMEFSSLYNHNPIHHTEHRVKSQMSIIKKMKNKGIETTSEMLANIMDIAGVRVVCPYIDDVYTLADMLISQSDIKLVRKSDYIKEPKENGYRSLHLIVSVPVFFSSSTEQVLVEIQLRTIAMDMWASLEHEIKYKGSREISEKDVGELKICAEMLHSVDSTMQNIYKHNG